MVTRRPTRTTRPSRLSASSSSSSRRKSQSAAHSKAKVRPSDAPASSWIRVRRPPAPNVGFEVEVWVRVDKLTDAERLKYLPESVESNIASGTDDTTAGAGEVDVVGGQPPLAQSIPGTSTSSLSLAADTTGEAPEGLSEPPTKKARTDDGPTETYTEGAPSVAEITDQQVSTQDVLPQHSAGPMNGDTTPAASEAPHDDASTTNSTENTASEAMTVEQATAEEPVAALPAGTTTTTTTSDVETGEPSTQTGL